MAIKKNIYNRAVLARRDFSGKPFLSGHYHYSGKIYTSFLPDVEDASDFEVDLDHRTSHLLQLYSRRARSRGAIVDDSIAPLLNELGIKLIPVKKNNFFHKLKNSHGFFSRTYADIKDETVVLGRTWPDGVRGAAGTGATVMKLHPQSLDELYGNYYIAVGTIIRQIHYKAGRQPHMDVSPIVMEYERHISNDAYGILLDKNPYHMLENDDLSLF